MAGRRRTSLGPVKPLNAIAMGLVVIALVASQGGYDLLPDPLGWVLVLVGLRLLRWPTTATWFAAIALAAACVLWVPATEEWLEVRDPSLRWAANLPQVGFLIALCLELTRRADAAGDAKGRAWWRTFLALSALLAVMPVVVFAAAGGDDALEAVYAAAGAFLLAVIVLLLVHAGRPWAEPAAAGGPAET